MTRLTRERDGKLASVAQAVEAAVSPADPYATSGQIELLQHQVERLAFVAGLLAERLDRAGMLNELDLTMLTDYQFSVNAN